MEILKGRKDLKSNKREPIISMTTATASVTALTYLQEMSSVYEAGFVVFFFLPPGIQPAWPCSTWFAGES